MEQIKFFKKNELDISRTDVTITADNGQDYVDFVRNRNNTSGWMTTGSVDADNTNFLVVWDDPVAIDRIILVGHNFKGYTISYWDGSAFQAFSTDINVTNNTETTTEHEFTSVNTERIAIVITGTMTANEDKRLTQLIAATAIGQLSGWPLIRNPKVGRNRTTSKMLSGKALVRENVGNFSCTLSVENWSSDADLALIEELYFKNEGFLLWLCGGDEDQFSSRRIGYRLEDIYLMKCADEHTPEWANGFYKSGMKIGIDMIEVVD